MTLEVIGCGLGRTGTKSLQLALELLGFGPCYHMDEAERRPEHDAAWLMAARGQPVDLRGIYQGYRAAVDWPTVTFWRELAQMWPNARFILTLRDPDEWVASMARTIIPTLEAPPGPHTRQAHREMARIIVADRFFGGRFREGTVARDAWQAHVEAVRSTLPAERLLELPIGAGWEPLCRFLDCPQPDQPWPNANSAEAFNRVPRRG